MPPPFERPSWNAVGALTEGRACEPGGPSSSGESKRTLPTACVIFAAIGLSETDADIRLRRLEDLFQGPVEHESVGQAVRGAVQLRSFGGAAREPRIWLWGELVAGLDSEHAVVAASDSDLRELDGAHGMIAVSGSTLRVVQGCGSPLVLYEARQGRATAWSSHAVAASILVRGAASLDSDAVRDMPFLAAPSGRRSLIAGVEVLDAGTVIDVDVRDVDVRATSQIARRSYWSRSDRWRDPGVPAEQLIADRLRRRVTSSERPWLALSGGRDSSALISIARRADLDLPAFTWGEPDWLDPAAAAHTASTLGLHHEILPYRPLADDDAIGYSLRLARESDGIAPAGSWARPELPAGMTAMVTGGGGEVGRAFYYASTFRSRPRPRPTDLVAAVAPGAPADVGGRVRKMLEELADETHLEGWDLLDAYYTEHRMGRWARGRVVAMHADIYTPFASPAVAAALVALPREARVSGRWHRAVVDPRIPLPEMVVQRKRVPPLARRVASRLRAMRVRREPWPWAEFMFAERPNLRRWLVDEAITAVEERLGRDQARRYRAALEEGLADGESALVAAGAGSLQLVINTTSPQPPPIPR